MRNTNKKHFMNSIAKDIIEMKFDKRTINNINKEIFKIARKYNIKQGTLSKDGVSVITNNYEWTMLKDCILRVLISQIEISQFLADIPKDLRY